MEESKRHIINVQNLYKVFGPNPERSFDLINQGKAKDDVFMETGLTIAVNNASFSVYEGEIFVVMGLSGSGKSTLVRMLNRLIDPTSGKVFLEGNDLAAMAEQELRKVRRNKMCMIFQSFALMPHMTVLQNAALGLDLAGVPRDERDKKAMMALEQVGLKTNARNYPKELSGGMQQRVGLARGLAVDPTIMLMDEAFSALDPLIRTEMQDELLKLQEQRQRTIIFISHDLDEAMRIGDRIAMMDDGRIVQVGTPEEILRTPANEYVKAFFRGVDPTNVLNAGDIVTNNELTIIGDSPQATLKRLLDQSRNFAYILDTNRRFQGVVSVDSLKTLIQTCSEGDRNLDKAFLRGVQSVSVEETMQDILLVIMQSFWPVPVVDMDNTFQGTISKDRILQTIHRQSDLSQ